MNYKLIACLLMLIAYAWKMGMNLLDYRSAGNKTPDNVKDIYNSEEYEKWRRYNAEKCRLSFISVTVAFVVGLVLIAADVYAAVAGGIANAYGAAVVVLLINSMLSFAADLYCSYYDTMVIEQKYGFNRSTKKTFFSDQVKGLIISLILICGLICAYIALHLWLADLVILAFAIFVFLLLLFFAFLSPFFMKLFNKFTPLEDGELKDKLTALLSKNGYHVKEIKVMDGSRRSTKSNAFFTGFGKTKTIVLFDTLIAAMTPDEICAVFAHEMGHGLHKDTLKNQAISLINVVLIACMIWLLTGSDALYPSFGFSALNYGMAFILLSECCLPIVSPLLELLSSGFSRRAEYKADKQAVQEGYGSELISALKKLSKENFSNLSPSPLLVRLTYSHPTTSQRITAIENAMKTKDQK